MTDANTTPAKPAKPSRAPKAPALSLSMQRFVLAILLVIALAACLYGAAKFKIDPALNTGLGVVVGGTLVPALKRAFDWFFPARGSDDGAHG